MASSLKTRSIVALFSVLVFFCAVLVEGKGGGASGGSSSSSSSSSSHSSSSSSSSSSSGSRPSSSGSSTAFGVPLNSYVGSSTLTYAGLIGIIVGVLVVISILGCFGCCTAGCFAACCGCGPRRKTAPMNVNGPGYDEENPYKDGLPAYSNGGVLPPGSQPYGSEYVSYENASNAEYHRAVSWFSDLGIVDSPTSKHGDGVPTPEQLAAIADRNSVVPGSAWDFNLPASPVPTQVVTCLAPHSGTPNGLLQQHVITFPYPDRTLPQGELVNRSVLSTLPLIPTKNPRLIYYELTILDLVFENPHTQPYTTVVAFGLSTSPYPEFRLPGWHAHSIAYHCDDGRLFVSDAFGGRLWQGPYGVGDTVGVGALLKVGGGFEGFFFTRNGRLLLGRGNGETARISEALVPLLPQQMGMLNKVMYASVGADGASQVGLNLGETAFVWEPANREFVDFA